MLVAAALPGLPEDQFDRPFSIGSICPIRSHDLGQPIADQPMLCRTCSERTQQTCWLQSFTRDKKTKKKCF